MKSNSQFQCTISVNLLVSKTCLHSLVRAPESFMNIARTSDTCNTSTLEKTSSYEKRNGIFKSLENCSHDPKNRLEVYTFGSTYGRYGYICWTHSLFLSIFSEGRNCWTKAEACLNIFNRFIELIDLLTLRKRPECEFPLFRHLVPSS
jgi:hypothetical protein